MKTLLAALTLVSLACPYAAADSGLTAAPVLNRPVGARSSAMGRAFAAVPGDPEGLMYNPAGLAFITAPRPYAAYMNGLVGGYGLVAAPFPVKGFVITPAFLYYNSGSMGLNLSDGTSGNVTAELDQVPMLSAAYRPIPRLAVGATVKRASIELAEAASAASVNFDAGAMYLIGHGFSAGASLMNAGQGMKFEDASDPAPRTLRAGLAWKLVPGKPNFMDPSADITYSEFIVTTDWSKTVKEDSRLQSGLETNMALPYGVTLSLRGGYLFSRDEEGATFGFGIKRGRWAFDFGFETAGELGTRRPVSLSYQF